MDYPNRVKNCATCNRWGGRRVIANPLNLPNYEIIKFEEVDYEKWNSANFMFTPSVMKEYISSVGCSHSLQFLFYRNNMGAHCKRHQRWVMLEMTVIDKALQFWFSKWYGVRHFKDSKIRDAIDSLILKIQYFFLMQSCSEIKLIENTATWCNAWVINPIFIFMYRLKITTHAPCDLIFFENLDETK